MYCNRDIYLQVTTRNGYNLTKNETIFVIEDCRVRKFISVHENSVAIHLSSVTNPKPNRPMVRKIISVYENSIAIDLSSIKPKVQPSHGP